MSLVALRAQQIADEATEHFNSGRSGLFVPGVRRVSNQGFEHQSIEDAFPDVAPGFRPLGNLVLVMLRVPVAKSSGGLIMDAELRKTERDNTQVGKVIALGPLAFHDRNTYTIWPEGAWCAVGDFVRVPKYQGDYTLIHYQRPNREFDEVTGTYRDFMTDDTVVFAQFKDLALLGVYPTSSDALAAKAFL